MLSGFVVGGLLCAIMSSRLGCVNVLSGSQRLRGASLGERSVHIFAGSFHFCGSFFILSLSVALFCLFFSCHPHYHYFFP